MDGENVTLATALQVAGTAVMAAASGFVGMLIGVKVQGSEIENLKERLDRMESKLDRLIERHE